MKLILCSYNEDILPKWQSQIKQRYEDIVICREERPLTDYIEELSSVEHYLIIYHLKSGVNEENALHTFLKQFPIAKNMLVLVNIPDTDQGIRLLSAGVHGYANAHVNTNKLLGIIDIIKQGEIWAGEDVLSKLLNKFPSDSSSYRRDPSLNELFSNREKQIVDQIVQGKTNPQIADELFITERTVKAHLTSIFKKTDTKNRFELAVKLQNI